MQPIPQKFPPEKEIAEKKQQLAQAQLLYSKGTVVMQEWTKVNDEAWLLRRRHVKGSHEINVPGQFRAALWNYSSPVDFDTADSNYQKFRVQHRFLPADPAPGK